MMKGGIVLLVLVGSMGAINCVDVSPIDCSSSRGAREPSAGRQACLDLRAQVFKQPGVKLVGKLMDEEDAAFDCVCSLSASNIHFVKVMNHALFEMLHSMETTYCTDNSPNVMRKGSLYDRMKALARLPQQSQRCKSFFLSQFQDNYYDLTRGEGVPDSLAAQRIVQHNCHVLVNDAVMTDFIEPTLEALQKSLGVSEDKFLPMKSGSVGLLNIINLKNLCLNVIGPKEDKSLHDGPVKSV